jgi:hypothetical protein
MLMHWSFDAIADRWGADGIQLVDEIDAEDSRDT